MLQDHKLYCDIQTHINFTLTYTFVRNVVAFIAYQIISHDYQGAFYCFNLDKHLPSRR